MNHQIILCLSVHVCFLEGVKHERLWSPLIHKKHTDSFDITMRNFMRRAPHRVSALTNCEIASQCQRLKAQTVHNKVMKRGGRDPNHVYKLCGEWREEASMQYYYINHKVP